MELKPEEQSVDNPLGTVFLTIREASQQQFKDETNHAAFSVTTNYKFNNEDNRNISFRRRIQKNTSCK